MDPNRLQNLINGYMQGTLSSADQAEFDSRFASEPAFSEKVTQSLGVHIGDPPAGYVDEVVSHLDARMENILQKGARSADRSLFLESGILVAALAVMVGAGSSLVTKDAMSKGDWGVIAAMARQFVENVKAARGK